MQPSTRDARRDRERVAAQLASTGPETLLPIWATKTLGARARDEALAKVARVAPSAYHAQARPPPVLSFFEPAAPAPLAAPEAPGERARSPDDLRAARREQRGAPLDIVAVSPSKKPARSTFDAEAWDPSRPKAAAKTKLAKPEKEAAAYQKTVETYWARIRNLTHRGAAHAAGAGPGGGNQTARRLQDAVFFVRGVGAGRAPDHLSESFGEIRGISPTQRLVPAQAPANAERWRSCRTRGSAGSPVVSRRPPRY